MTLTSNPAIHTAYKQWKSMIEPSNLVLTVLNDLLIQTNYGKIIFDANQILLQSHMNHIMILLNEEGIEYIKPFSGIFFMINLSKILKLKYLRFNEFYLWKKIVDEYSLNISPGKR